MVALTEKKRPRFQRWKITEEQRQCLEHARAVLGELPKSEALLELTQHLGVKPRQVRVWFQNKRQRKDPPSQQAWARAKSARGEEEKGAKKEPEEPLPAGAVEEAEAEIREAMKQAMAEDAPGSEAAEGESTSANATKVTTPATNEGAAALPFAVSYPIVAAWPCPPSDLEVAVTQAALIRIHAMDPEVALMDAYDRIRRASFSERIGLHLDSRSVVEAANTNLSLFQMLLASYHGPRGADAPPLFLCEKSVAS